MKQVVSSLVSIPSLEVSYLIVNKRRIQNQSFKNAAYGIGYNYFSGVLLSELVFQDSFHNVNIIYDPRNKETHQKKHFREYLETRILGNALENEVDISLSITSEDSSKCYGLLAVDYFSWSIFRKFEYGDDSYFSLIQDKLKRRREWYI